MAQVKKSPTSSQFLANAVPVSQGYCLHYYIIPFLLSHPISPQLPFNIQQVSFFSTTTQDLTYNDLSTFQMETRQKHFPGEGGKCLLLIPLYRVLILQKSSALLNTTESNPRKTKTQGQKKTTYLKHCSMLRAHFEDSTPQWPRASLFSTAQAWTMCSLSFYANICRTPLSLLNFVQ